MLENARFIVELLVLAVAAGYWAGEIKARRRGDPVRPAPTHSEEPGVNGKPSLGELSRRLDAMQQEFRDDRRNYLQRHEAETQFEGLWGAIKDLRTMDTAIGRRVDGLFREGV